MLRVLVALHDDATAVALVGGDKTGHWVEWYEVAVPTAEGLDAAGLRRGPRGRPRAGGPLRDGQVVRIDPSDVA